MKKYLAMALLVGAVLCAAASAQEQSKTGFVPLAPVRLVKPSGQVKSYGLAAADAATRGTALLAAISASAAGDTVELLADATVSTTVGKDDLHLEIATGTTLKCSTASTVSTVSDDGGAFDMFIKGGRIVRASNGKGAAVKITNPASNVRIECEEIVNEKTSIGANPDKANLEGCAVFQDGGTAYIDAQLISGTFGAWWDAGDGYIHAQKIIGAGSAEYSLALYAEPDAGETGQWWVDCPHLKAPTPMLLRTASGSGTARIWIQSSLIEGSGVDVPKILIDNVFAYITCQKIAANTDDTGYTAGWIDVSGGAHFYLWAQKFSTRGGADGAAIAVYESGTTAYINIDEVDDANGLPTLGLLTNTTATTYYNGRVLHLATASRDALSCYSGVLTVQSGDITTQSSCNDLYRTGGTLTVSPAVKYDATKTTGTITKQQPYGLTSSMAGQESSAVAITGGTASGISSAALTSSGTLSWASRSILTSPADSQVLMTNAAGNAFSMLQFGGTTSSFPALKRSGTFLHARLADDSDYASFVSKNLAATGTAVTFSSLPTSDPAVAGQIFHDSGVLKLSGQTDEPLFNAVNLGHASDTTLARVSAGVVSVEGVTIATRTGTETFTNKTLTSPIISSISNTGTITLPTSTDTLVGRATTDTLTNKTLTTPAFSGTPTGTVTSGTYTPTCIDTTNIQATTEGQFNYIRVGNIVYVTGHVSVDPTATGATVFKIPLPIASNLAAADDLSGTVSEQVVYTGSTSSVKLIGDATNDAASVEWSSIVGTGARDVGVSFSYEVL